MGRLDEVARNAVLAILQERGPPFAKDKYVCHGKLQFLADVVFRGMHGNKLAP